MRSLLVAMLLAVGMHHAPMWAAGPGCQQAVFDRMMLRPSVCVLVATPGGSGYGSGVVLLVEGRPLILTAAHVVRAVVSPREVVRVCKRGRPVKQIETKPLPVRMVNRSGKVLSTRTARVVWMDRNTDLALLKPDSSEGLSVAELCEEAEVLDPGEDCWYCGAGGGIHFNLQKAIINQEANGELLINGGGWYGHSGSGVMVRRNGRWRVCGVLLRLKDRTNPQSPMGCANLETIHTFLRSYKSQPR